MDVKKDEFFDVDPFAEEQPAETLAETPVETEQTTEQITETPVETEQTTERPAEELATTATEITPKAVENDGFFAETATGEKDVRLPFPESDYKNGKLKKVRGRMLGKLLKYELKYMLLPVLISIGVLLVASVLLALQISGVGADMATLDEYISGFILLLMLYGYANIAVLVMPFGLAEKRMMKNFFKEEAAVTFSIPASAEEHLLAKHLGTVICELISLLAILLGGFILGASIEGIFEDTGITVTSPVDVVHIVFYSLEGVILFLQFLVGLPVLGGASCCFLHKFSEKKRFGVTFLIVLVVMFLLNGASTLLMTTGAYRIFDTAAGIHIFACICILFNTAIIALCIWYELHTLKRKLNV